MKEHNSLNLFLTIFLYIAFLAAGLADVLQYNLVKILLVGILIILIINLIRTDRLKKK